MGIEADRPGWSSVSQYHDDYRRMSGQQRKDLTDQIYQEAGGICHICQLPVRREDASLDHLIPASQGGLSTRDNLALAHRACNSSRQDKTINKTQVPVYDGLAWFTASDDRFS